MVKNIHESQRARPRLHAYPEDDTRVPPPAPKGS